MLSHERETVLSSFRNGRQLGDLYYSVAPQVIEKIGPDMARLKRIAYGLGAQKFHEASSLSKAFPDFNPINLEDSATALGYVMGFTLSFNRDALGDYSGEDVEKAKRGFKYEIAVSAVKKFAHTLREEQIPDPETRAFYYFKEVLFSDRDPLEIFTSILIDHSFQNKKETEDVLDMCRTMFLMRVFAGSPTKRFPNLQEEYLAKSDISMRIEGIIRESKACLNELDNQTKWKQKQLSLDLAKAIVPAA